MSVAIAPERVDVERMWERFERFVAADTSARVGENRIAPTDERLESFARDVAAPALRELGAEIAIDDLNNVVARFGEDRGTELLLVSYSAIHHGNQMSDPLRARRADLGADQRWSGLGAGQSKGALAAMCAALELLRAEGFELAGKVTIAVSTEGGSSHTSAKSLYAGFSRLPAGAVLAVGTENRLSLGNRGRVDVVVEIHGLATHSSSPETGRNPIEVVGAVLERVSGIELDGDVHTQLGPRALVPYKLECGPVAPHTIPAWCVLVLDRRTLPGEAEERVVAEIADALAGLPVSVTAGPTMLPSLVEESAGVVRALQAGAGKALGRPLETFYPPYTFDAGYPCALGVPTVMYGPSSTEIATAGILGEDAVLMSQLRDAAAVYAGAITQVAP